MKIAESSNLFENYCKAFANVFLEALKSKCFAESINRMTNYLENQ